MDTLELIYEFLKSLDTSNYTVFHSQLLENPSFRDAYINAQPVRIYRI